ncbi:MAG: thiamine-phosphate kinase [Phycisphaera sp.]|nr:thiamine-phosphate kinase [Phycisphaera sp.]
MREFELLRHVYDANARLPGSVVIPPGDDMGAVRFGNNTLLVTVDQLVEGVHFAPDTPIEKIGRKVVTRNLSDVAAMAALPVAAVAAGCLPRSMAEATANQLFDSMRATSLAFGCPLIGGDVSMHDGPMVLSVALFAEPGGVTPILRSGAKAGDLVCVTGELGGAMEDLAGCVHHLDFEPRIDLARKLAKMETLHSLIDLSDGLGRDLGHIAEMSGLHAVIEASKLPISTAAKHAAARDGQAAWRHALADGEDYELCFTVPAGTLLPTGVEGVRITTIGVMQPGPPGVTVQLPNGQKIAATELGWEHHT